ncbi:hypothetical protein VNO77_18840 [Canavalia gladiata]|uniref:Uncharacterized protein n=1 Tax=Canavalia gladiata TaxID=3824 RepID=A0AAN9QK00_CANGL
MIPKRLNPFTQQIHSWSDATIQKRVRPTDCATFLLMKCSVESCTKYVYSALDSLVHLMILPSTTSRIRESNIFEPL